MQICSRPDFNYIPYVVIFFAKTKYYYRNCCTLFEFLMYGVVQFRVAIYIHGLILIVTLVVTL